MTAQASAAGATATHADGVAELAQEVLERAPVAVAADHHAAPVVVAEQLVPEPHAVADDHRVVPGRRDDEGDSSDTTTP